MTIWALADLHLSFGVPNKEMDVFGAKWKNHPEKIHSHWTQQVKPDDLVLLPGDISWAMDVEAAMPDLEWIHALPGTKLMLRGNHDYWWTSLSKIEKIMPPSIHLLQNNIFRWGDVAIGGARLWDTPEFTYQEYIEFVDNPRANKLTERSHEPREMEKIFMRELGRLELSLKALPKDAKVRIAITHYPPVGPHLSESRASQLLEKYNITHCAFGHIHNLKQGIPLFGTKNGIEYTMVACDYVNFHPIQIYP